MTEDRRVLRDIRVLDFGRFISAPYCGMMLADMGAEVIRVEKPGGEEDRFVGLTAENGENFTYPGLARNKKGITLDVRAREGRAVLKDLVAGSDVFLHNFSPAAVNALELRYEHIRAYNSAIVYTGISCFGTEGPRRDSGGFDPMAQAGSGAAAVTGFAGGPPLRSGVPWVDYSTGLCAALGTLLALRHRDRTGEGQAVDCGLLQTAVSYTAPMIAEATIAGRERPRLGNRGAYLGPSDLYRCRDGYVYAATPTEAMWRSLVKLIGRPDLEKAAELRTGVLRFENRATVDPVVERWMEERTVEEAVTALEKARIPCGVYRATSEVPADPQVAACDMIEYLDLESQGLESVPVSGLPVRLSRTPGGIVSRPPRVGEHNREIYGDLLGYTRERIERLESSGIL